MAIQRHRVVVGECETFPGAADYLVSHGVEVINLNLEECKQLTLEFVAENPSLWNDYLGR